MPFTAAHPAAVLPLRNRLLLPWSGLVIGAMTPDFEYFFMGTVNAGSHSIPGLFIFCLPAGLAAWGLFHFLMKRPLAYLLPDEATRRVWGPATRQPEISARSLLAVGAAVVVGAASHLLWDAFTHGDRWGTHHIPELRLVLANIHGYYLTVYRLLQHISSFVGMAILAVALVRWYREQTLDRGMTPILSTGGKLAILAALFVTSAIPAIVFAILTSPPVVDGDSLQIFVWLTITSGLGFAILGSIIYSAVVMVAQRQMARIRAH